MRKLYLLFLGVLLSTAVMAATTVVTNSGTTFTPANITITQGDTVQFNIGGSHNVVEVSQATYNANGTTSNGGFTLPFGGGQLTGLTAGTYYYVCTPHASLGMKGTITVSAPPTPAPWINEFHYDNAGSDVDEGVEIAGVAGTDLSCYALMLYNGNDSELYGNNDSIVLTGTIDDEGCGYGAVWFGLPANGLQNGSPDGIGLWNHCTNTIVQFISYEGVITAADGPMLGATSEDVGVFESFSQVVGGSLQLMGIGTQYSDFTWDSTAVNSNGDLNPNQSLCGAPTDTLVSFSSTSGNTLEGAGTFTLNLSINQATTSNVTVDVNLLTGTSANLGNTFPETVTFMAGNTSATLDITLNDDAVVEPDETYEFILENGAGLVLGSDSIFTLTVDDDDTPIPAYDIATVTTNGVGEIPDSMGVECKLYGIANSPERGFNSTEFSMQDATGGITVYNGGPSITYEAEVGDSIEVHGIIGQRFGVTVITDLISVTELSTGNTVTDVLSAGPTEANESELIRVDGLELIDPTQWAAAGGSGFDVDVYTPANDTFVLRIDRDYADLYNSEPPCGSFDAIGVAGQFDADSVYDSGYQLLPRTLADVLAMPCPIVDREIAEINGVNANGEADSLGLKVRTTGYVNSPDRGFNSLEFSMQKNGAGITVFTNDTTYDNLVVEVGDELEIVGVVSQSVGVVTLESIESINVLSTGNTVTELVSTEINDDNESELIRLEDLTLVDAAQWTAAGGSGFTVEALDENGDTIDIRIDRDYADLYNSSAPTASCFAVIGVSSQFDPSTPYDEGYQIIPRFLTDIIECEDSVSINELNITNFIAAPIPADNSFTVSFDYASSEVMTIQLVDVIGQTVSSQTITTINGVNRIEVPVADLTAGVYVLHLQTENGLYTQQVMVK